MTSRSVPALAAIALCAACAAPPAPRPSVARNVLVVTIDTLRADRVGVYGAAAVETPHLDRLAREGAWAVQADVPAPLTRPSHASLFTGLLPPEHGVRDNIGPPLRPDAPLLAEILARQGFATGAFLGSSVLDRQSGLARGFSTYSDRFEGSADQRSGDLVVREAIAWMKSQSGRTFSWVHLYDPHAPYTPPEPYASRYAGRPYDGEVAWSDDLVGRLVASLRDAGTLDDTLVVVTSDHGEALGDHGEDVHGYFVYEATMRVPFIVRGPGVRAGTRLDAVARTIDVCPTVVDLAGIDARGQTCSGRSLASALRGEPMSDEPSFGESLVPLIHYGWSDLRSVRDGRWKYILAPRPELYDLSADPDEKINLAEREASRAAAMRAGIEARLRAEKTAPPAANRQPNVPPDLLERLGSLGYVSASGARDRQSAGADPKDKLEEYKAVTSLMQQALVALHGGKPGVSVERLHTLATRGFDSYELHYYLGRSYSLLQKPREAAQEYARATAMLPGAVEAWRGLGEARVALGDKAGAVGAFERVVPLAPGDAVALMQLGEAYRDVARWGDAARVIHQALAIDPGPAQYWNSLGTVLGSGGRMAEAERAFAEAQRRDPNNPLYIYNHGLALQQLGRRDEAAAELRRAAALGYRARGAGS